MKWPFKAQALSKIVIAWLQTKHTKTVRPAFGFVDGWSCWSVMSVNTPQASVSLCDDLDQYFLYTNRSVYQLLAAWQVSCHLGLHYLVSLLICIVDKNLWINPCPRQKFGALCPPCSHLCVSKVSLQNEISSIWKWWRLLWLKKTKKQKHILAWKYYGNTSNLLTIHANKEAVSMKFLLS